MHQLNPQLSPPGLGATPPLPTPAVPALPSAQNLALPGVFQGTSAQQSWNQIQTQIQAEGQAAGLSATQIANNLAVAQKQYLNKLQGFIDSGITSVQPNLATLAQAAQTATLATTSALGAVQAVQGIAAGIASGNPQQVEAGVQALVGVISAVAIGTGTVSAGVGAAIGAAIELTFEILNAAGILGGPPPGSVSVGDGTCSNQGFTSAGQSPVGGVIPSALQSGLVSPGANGEGVCVWGTLVSPGSVNWRTFPDPNDANDAALWYAPVTEATWYWPPGASQAKWYTKNAANWRAIDNAFHRYRQLECEASMNYQLTNGGGPGVSTTSLTGDVATAVPAFLSGFFAMWKKNAEFALNGVNPAPDTVVLEQYLATWNAAHSPGTTFTFTAAPSDLQGQSQGAECSAVTGGYSYVSMLVADLVNGNSTALTNGALLIKTGPQLTPPNTISPVPVQIVKGTPLPSTAPATSTTSTGTVVVAGTAVVAGAALLGTAAYAYATKRSLGEVLSAAWKKVR